MLLEAFGCDVDISDSGAELRRWLDKSPEYAMVIVCHTVSEEERLSIESHCRAQASTAVVYCLEGAMAPEEFELRISECLDRLPSRLTDQSVRARHAPLRAKLLPLLALACHL